MPERNISIAAVRRKYEALHRDDQRPAYRLYLRYLYHLRLVSEVDADLRCHIEQRRQWVNRECCWQHRQLKDEFLLIENGARELDKHVREVRLRRLVRGNLFRPNYYPDSMSDSDLILPLTRWWWNRYGVDHPFSYGAVVD